MEGKAARHLSLVGRRDRDPLLGSVVAGRYEVASLLGQGGAGRIYRARQRGLDREIALKVLTTGSFVDDVSVFEERFRKEAAILAKLSHAGIVVVHDYGEIEDLSTPAFFIAMELVEGRTLLEELASGPFEPARALRVARDIARALRRAHRKGVVHRDLKPSNIMLTDSGDGEQVKVLDFGIAKLLRGEQQELTQEGVLLGSPKYMAPEQIQHGEVDGRTDVYALGVVLFEMLTGRPPFVGRESVQTLLMHVNDPPPPIGITAPPEVERLVHRCLEKSPAARYASADELIGALDALLARLGAPSLAASDPSGAWAPEAKSGEIETPVVAASAEPPRRAQPSRAAAFALLALASIAIVAVLALRLPHAALDAPPQPEGTGLAHEALPASPAARDEPVAVAEPSPDPVAITAPPEAPALHVESTPPGATLRRAGDATPLGTTPLDLPLPAGETPVSLRLELAGHAPYVWTQGALDAPATIHAELTRLTRRRRPPTAGDEEPAPPPDDIRVAR